jgi:hypothetical protein
MSATETRARERHTSSKTNTHAPYEPSRYFPKSINAALAQEHRIEDVQV